MAAAYKCTRIAVGTQPALSSGMKSVVFNFIDPRVSPPPAYSVQGEVPEGHISDPDTLETDINTILSDQLWPDVMDWTA